MSVPWVKASKLNDIALARAAYGIPGVIVDGMDVLDVRGAVLKAAERARQGHGPTLIEAKSYRWYGHSHSDPRAYRTREEEAEWRKRDPIKVLKEKMYAIGMLSDDEFTQLEEAVQEKLGNAMAFGEASPEPAPEDVFTDVFAPSPINPCRDRKGEAIEAASAPQ